MPNETATCNTPRYVLREDREPVGPQVVQSNSAATCSAIYGFSDKRAYDIFTSSNNRDLRPYPLMKAYLKNRIADESGEALLIVVDAATLTDDRVTVATMENVLAAHGDNAPQIKNGFYLMRIQQADEYEWRGHSS